MSFARAHGMMFFETSAKKSPKNCSATNGCGRSDGGTRYQQDKVDDIVTAVGAKLKRQKKPPVANSVTYAGSFKVTNKKGAEKEAWNCC